MPEGGEMQTEKWETGIQVGDREREVGYRNKMGDTERSEKQGKQIRGRGKGGRQSDRAETQGDSGRQGEKWETYGGQGERWETEREEIDIKGVGDKEIETGRRLREKWRQRDRCGTYDTRGRQGRYAHV